MSITTTGYSDRASAALGQRVQVTAHRGSSRRAPENSLSALRQAISDGADSAEIDVQETRDGVPVLIHDGDLMRIARHPGNIWELTYAEVLGLDIGSWFSPAFAAERIATLEQALAVARGSIGLNIELKDNGHGQRLAERTVELVRQSGWAGHCLVTSQDQTMLARVHQLAPEIKIGQIPSTPGDDLAIRGISLLSLPWEQVSAERIARNRRAGLDTHVWTVNDPAVMTRMLELGVDGIITDDPRRLRDLITEREGVLDAGTARSSRNRRPRP